MDKILQGAITSEQLIVWLIIAFLVGYFVYKEWPEFKKRMSGIAVKELTDKELKERLAVIEEDIRQIKLKLNQDYDRLNDMEKWKGSMEQLAAASLEEREILMTAMLSILKAQKDGVNGTTDEAIHMIQKYINKQAHKRGESYD